MALPQRKSENQEYSRPYQYQVRNAERVERRRPKLNDDFQYLKNAEFAEASNEDRLLSSENPTWRNRDAAEPVAPAANDEEFAEDEGNQVADQIKSSIKKRLAGKKGAISLSPQKTALKLALKSRSTVISGAIVSWGMTAWTGQFIFALLGAIFLGLMGAGDAVVNSNFVTSAIAWITNRVTEAVTGAVTGTAVNMGDIAAAGYGIFYLLVLAIGLTTLLIASIQYMMAMIHPLSGSHTSMKYIAFLIAVIGYSVPLLNLFPWFLVFVAVVWKYPK